MMNINKIKDFWVELNFGQVADFIGGGTPDKSEIKYWKGNIPWASVKDIKGEYLHHTIDSISELGLRESNSRIAKQGELILITRISPGKTTIAKIDTAINQDLKIVRPKVEVDIKFLHYLFATKEKEIVKKSSGTTVLGIRLEILKQIQVLLPPLSTQHLIVSKIESLFSELDKAVESLKTAQQQLKTYRQSVLKWAFEGRLTNENVKEGELPEGWERKLIKDACSNIKVGIVVKPTQYYSPSQDGIKVFRSANVREFRVNDNDWVFFTKKGNEVNKRTQVFEGDVLLVRSGYPGTSCVVPKQFDGCNAIDILIATPDQEVVLSEYLCAFNNSPLGKGMFEKNARGMAQRHLNVGEYSRLEISFPSIEEQKSILNKIESRLSVADKMEASITESLQQAEALRQSILKRAFEGSLV